MAAYLTYEKYQEFGGSLDETTFNDFAFEAQSVIDWITFNRLKNETTLPEAVERLMYRLIGLIQAKQAASAVPIEGGGTVGGVAGSISSQSNDGVSISYNVLSASEAANLIKEQMEGIVQRYLQGVKNSLGRKVLYRGLYPGE